MNPSFAVHTIQKNPHLQPPYQASLGLIGMVQARHHWEHDILLATFFTISLATIARMGILSFWRQFWPDIYLFLEKGQSSEQNSSERNIPKILS